MDVPNYRIPNYHQGKDGKDGDIHQTKKNGDIHQLGKKITRDEDSQQPPPER
jgi:hypothetical protein